MRIETYAYERHGEVLVGLVEYQTNALFEVFLTAVQILRQKRVFESFGLTANGC